MKKAAESIGYPVVLKVCSPEVSHKTESGLVAVDLRNEADLEPAFQRIGAASPVKDAAFLVQEMVKGGRELVDGDDPRSPVRALRHVRSGGDIYRDPGRCHVPTGAAQ